MHITTFCDSHQRPLAFAEKQWPLNDESKDTFYRFFKISRKCSVICHVIRNTVVIVC